MWRWHRHGVGGVIARHGSDCSEWLDAEIMDQRKNTELKECVHDLGRWRIRYIGM